MFAAEEFYTWDRRENRAIDNLCPSLGQALATGKTAVVRPFQTSLTNAQLVAIAVSMCELSEANVAVVGSHDGQSLAFVPLFGNTSFARTQLTAEARRGRRRPSAAPWSAAAAGPGGSVTI